jgi:site-specific DNA recombinase
LDFLGYDVRERKLVVNQDEARTVREIFERYLELGSVRELKNDLDLGGMVSAVKLSRKGNRRGGRQGMGFLLPDQLCTELALRSREI